MKLIVHDLEKEVFNSIFDDLPQDVVVIGPERGEIHPCIGCFGCWTKQPGRCILRDAYDHMGLQLGQAEQLLTISRIVYGGFSPFVKNIMDRSLGYILPFFTLRGGEMHHCARYPDKLRWTVGGYGEAVTQEEQATFRQLIQANGVNFLTCGNDVQIAQVPEALAGLREVLR